MARDNWDKADVVGKLAGAILIPVALAIGTYFFNQALQERADRQKTRELAITVLQSEATEKTPELRQWALGVFQEMTKSASQTLPPGVINELQKAPLPTAQSVRGPISVVGKSFTPTEFREYVRTLVFTDWHPQFVVLHNTSQPKLSTWHDLSGEVRMRNLADYFGGIGWSGGPHLFIDDERIWVFNPLTKSGVHSPSWNAISWGVDMVGDYSEEPFNEKVRDNTVQAIAALDAVGHLDAATLRFHKEDPKTTHNDCPGSNVNKDDLIQRIRQVLQQEQKR